MGFKNRLTNILLSPNSFMTKIRSFLMSFSFVENIVFHSKMDDKEYIRMKYREQFGVYPDLDNPKNFNEKNNWRKLNDRQDIYTSMVDKYKIKEVIKSRVGEKYMFPLLGVWDSASMIDFDSLPDKYVLKCNHAGGVVVCRDNSTFNRTKATKFLNSCMKKNYYIRSREWPYKNVERKIIAEKYMGENLIDYKNYCFNGKLLFTLVWQNHAREDGLKPDAHFCGAYDREWNKTDFDIDYPSDDTIVTKPDCYDELVEVTEKMSKGIPFVRVDCYIVDNHVYVGEMTFFPWGGFQKFKDEKWNNYLGSLQKLPGIDY